MDYLLAQIEVKSLDDKTGQFEGYASTFGNVDNGKDVVEKGAFTETLAEHAANKTLPAMFFSHDIREPVGDWLEMGEDRKGLYCKGQLWIGEGIPKVQQTYRMLKGTGAKGLSIGYGYRGKDAVGYDEKKGIRYLKNLNLFETSPTPFPMNAKATITAIKSATTLFSLIGADGALLSKRDMEKALRDAGLSAEQSKAFLAAGYGALLPPQRDAGLKALLDTIDNTTARIAG